MSKWNSYSRCYSFPATFPAGAKVKSWTPMFQTRTQPIYFFFFMILKDSKQNVNHSWWFMRKKTRRAQAITPAMHQTLHFTSVLPAIFLLCCLFCAWKGILKKISNMQEREKWGGEGGWRSGGKRVQQEIDFIVCGRWMMAQHKNPHQSEQMEPTWQ